MLVGSGRASSPLSHGRCSCSQQRCGLGAAHSHGGGQVSQSMSEIELAWVVSLLIGALQAPNAR